MIYSPCSEPCFTNGVKPVMLDINPKRNGSQASQMSIIMSYNEKLEDRIDHYFIAHKKLTKNKQMGGVGWLANGNMCVGIYEDLLVVRVHPAKVDGLIQNDGIHIFGHREGKQDNFLSVSRAIYKQPEALQKFLSHALKFTSSLKPNPQHDQRTSP